jgi:hypothetical protein
MEETSTPAVTTKSAGIRYGLILGVLSIAYFIIMNLLGVDMSQGIGRWAGLVFTIGSLFLAQKYFKDNGDGFMSFGQGFGIGFWIALIATPLSSAFSYIYMKFIDQGFVQQLLDRTREQMEEKGNLSEEQIDQAMQMTSKFMTPESILIFGLIGGFIITLVCALIVTIFTQKKAPEGIV